MSGIKCQNARETLLGGMMLMIAMFFSWGLLLGDWGSKWEYTATEQ